MKRIIILGIIAAMTFISCEKEEEKEVCTICTYYDDVNNTSFVAYDVCLTESTMENFIDELNSFNDASHHYVCTDPK